MNCIIHTMFLVIRTTYVIYSSMTVTYVNEVNFVERSDLETPLHQCLPKVYIMLVQNSNQEMYMFYHVF